MSSLDAKINNLEAGKSIMISTFNNIVCSVERTGDGKTLRFLRTFANGSFEVYNTVAFFIV